MTDNVFNNSPLTINNSYVTLSEVEDLFNTKGLRLRFVYESIILQI
jgi:chromosome segregation ATPase